MNDPHAAVPRDEPPAGDVAAEAGRGRGSGLLAMIAGGVAVLLLAAAGAFTAYWFFAIATLEERVALWIEQHQADGLRIAHGRSTRGGFPMQLRLTLADGTIATPGGWGWQSPRTTIDTPLLRPDAIEVRFEGEQRLNLPPTLGGHTLVARAERLAMAPEPGGWLPTGRLAGTGIVLGAPGSGQAARIDRFEATAVGDPARAAAGPEEGSYDLTLTLQSLLLPAAAALPLGDRVERLTLEARLMGALAPRPWPEALRRWQDDGGTIEITRLAADYGALRLTGDGTVALDGAGEIVAAFAVTAKGLDETLDALAAQAVIGADVAAAARFLLSPPGSGADAAPGRSAMVRVPVSIQDRILFLGPLPVAQLPPPPWLAQP